MYIRWFAQYSIFRRMGCPGCAPGPPATSLALCPLTLYISAREYRTTEPSCTLSSSQGTFPTPLCPLLALQGVCHTDPAPSEPP